MTITEFEKMFRNFIRVEPTGCWTWAGPRSRVGVPKPVRVGERMVTPMRLTWEAYVNGGATTDWRLQLVRRCGTIDCVAPDHRDPINTAVDVEGVLQFGRHAGQHISDVPSQYLSWIVTVGEPAVHASAWPKIITVRPLAEEELRRRAELASPRPSLDGNALLRDLRDAGHVLEVLADATGQDRLIWLAPAPVAPDIRRLVTDLAPDLIAALKARPGVSSRPSAIG